MDIGSALDSKSNNFNLMRLVFAAFVVYTHSFAVLRPEFPDPMRSLLASTHLSEIGVNGFFLLSGFLITRSVIHGSFVYYAISRILRIYPALIISTILTIFVMSFFSDLDFKSYILHPQTGKFLIVNSTLFSTVVGLLPGVFVNHRISVVNVSLWTLVVELRMYFIIGVLGVSGIMRKPVIAKSVLVVMLILLLTEYGPNLPLVHEKDNWIRVSMYFLWGALIYFLRFDIPMDRRIFISSLLLFYWLQGKPGYDLLVVLPFSYIVFYLGVGFSFKDPVKNFGDLSYGLYIYSFPIQQILLIFYSDINVYLHMTITLLIASILAFFSWWLIEARALMLKRALASRLNNLYGGFIN